jgi:hypothetical protein
MHYSIRILFPIAAAILLTSCSQLVAETAKRRAVSSSSTATTSPSVSSSPSTSIVPNSVSPGSSAAAGKTVSSKSATVPTTGSSISPALQTSADEALAVMKDHITALNAENVPAYMATIHPSSPGYKKTEETVNQIFQAYDIRATFDQLEIVSITSNKARVRYTQTSRKIKGPAYRDSRATGIHTLKKHQGKWKLSETKSTSTEFLN